MTAKLENLQCLTCGCDLTAVDANVYRCPACGGEYAFSTQETAFVSRMNIAGACRRRGDYDAAITEYETLVQDYPDEEEACWGAVLSTYGIEYVYDDRTGQNVPTCHRYVRKSILDDPHYHKAFTLAKGEQKARYVSAAAEINMLQQGISRKMESESDFDVFLSFKATDEKGNATKDRYVARRIYDELIHRGYRVFFSDVTLQGRSGTEFEPIIFRALFSAKAFILVATDPAYIASPWIKNEWARFRDRMREEGESGLKALAVFENIPSLELPPIFRNTQGVNLSRYPAGGYEVDIADGLDKSFKRAKSSVDEQLLEKKVNELASRLQGNTAPTPATLLKRAEQELEDGDFSEAVGYFSRVLELEPENAEAWWGMLRCECSATTDSQLETYPKHLCKMSAFMKAERYAEGSRRDYFRGVSEKNVLYLRTEKGKREYNYSNLASRPEAERRAEEEERQRQVLLQQVSAQREADRRRRRRCTRACALGILVQILLIVAGRVANTDAVHGIGMYIEYRGYVCAVAGTCICAGLTWMLLNWMSDRGSIACVVMSYIPGLSTAIGIVLVFPVAIAFLIRKAGRSKIR